MATVKDFVRKGLGPEPSHAYDDPNLSAIEFLRACMHDQRLPLTTRMDAAAKLLPLTESARPPVRISEVKIIIEGLHDQESVAQDPDATPGGKIGNQQSKDRIRSNSPRPFLTTPGPSYIEKVLERIPLSEIMEIVSRCPDHLLPLCRCGHRMMYVYADCGCPHPPDRLN